MDGPVNPSDCRSVVSVLSIECPALVERNCGCAWALGKREGSKMGIHISVESAGSESHVGVLTVPISECYDSVLLVVVLG